MGRLIPWPALLLLPGCTFGPGAGFARVAATSVQLSLDSATLVDLVGREVVVEAARLSFDTVEVQALEGADSVDFDPADPPDGYTLCHGEHCHSTSGELVPYDEIIADLSGGTASFEAVGVIDAGVEASLLSGAVVSLTGSAPLPLASIARVALTAPRLVLEGGTDDGLDVLVEVSPTVALSGELLYDVERTGPDELRLLVEVAVPDTLLDGVDLESAVVDGVAVIGDPEGGPAAAVDEALRTSVVHGTLSPVD